MARRCLICWCSVCVEEPVVDHGRHSQQGMLWTLMWVMMRMCDAYCAGDRSHDCAVLYGIRHAACVSDVVPGHHWGVGWSRRWAICGWNEGQGEACAREVGLGTPEAPGLTYSAD